MNDMNGKIVVRREFVNIVIDEENVLMMKGNEIKVIDDGSLIVMENGKEIGYFPKGTFKYALVVI